VTLDPGYLEYAARRRGMDHDLYPWSNLFERPPITWPGDAKVAVWAVVSLEWFPMVPDDQPFRAPGHMQTPYPDYRHYTVREYGTRVGFYRLLDAFAAAAVRVSVAANAAIAERYPQVIADIVAAGHEVIAHSTDMNWNTPRLLAEAGVEYVCDWPNDELPYRITTAAGEIVNLPLNHELSDRQVITVQQQSADSYAQQVLDAHQWLRAEAERFGGRMLPLHLAPYIIGLPYRIGALEGLLAGLKGEGAWFARGDELLDAWRGQQ
jgi:hypothetical protein